MPCKECGESAREKHAGVCVGLHYTEDGVAQYYCLDCVKEMFENLRNEQE